MAELGLTAWDWFVLATVVLSIGLGFIRGLVRTIFALAAWVVSLLGVPVAMHWLVPVLPPELPYALLVVVIFLTLFSFDFMHLLSRKRFEISWILWVCLTTGRAQPILICPYPMPAEAANLQIV